MATSNEEPNNNEGQGNNKNNLQHPHVEAIEIFEKIQEHIQRASIFSSNESLSDIQTSSLPLLAIEYHMAKTYLQLRTASSTSRNGNVKKAVDLFHLFLHRCDTYEGILENDIQQQYRTILAEHDSQSHEEEEPTSNVPLAMPTKPLPSPSRDEKIARYKRSKEIKNKISLMTAQLSQRKRLQLDHHEEIDGHDEDSLMRSLHLHQINEFALDTIEELFSSNMELQMLQMAVRMERDRADMDRHRPVGMAMNAQGGRGPYPMGMMRPPPPNPNQKMKLTQVLQDPNTGQLIFKRQELKSAVFRPSWNQPTMSLDELAEKEVREAREREASQKVSEANAKNAPRRYEFLVRDGMEDDANLVDASAKLDREWDDWKDENPKGSGNKMGDRGDRNF